MIRATPVPQIAAFPIGQVTCAALPWRTRGQLRVSAIVKATFAFVPDSAMRQVDPEPLFAAEVHHQDSPVMSIRAASDLSPELARVDVIFTGHAHAPPGKAALRVSTQLSLLRRGAKVLDKTLHVVGDRTGKGFAPFRRMPIIYEKTYGGIGHRDNPLGVGDARDQRYPNIIDPTRPRGLAGFGPISRAWHARKGLLTPEQRSALGQAIPELLEPFDWSYFQSAPPDQRIDVLEGDEWLVLCGLHPALPRLATQLPGASAMARFRGPQLPGGERSLALRADTLRIDGDAKRCSIVFRGSIEVAREDAISSLALHTGVALPAAPIRWPDWPPHLAEAETRGREPARAGAPVPLERTHEIGPDTHFEASRRDPLPFKTAKP
jgi:hypothetical protein